MPSAAQTYAFDNDDPDAGQRHVVLAAILDGFTFARLDRLGDLTGRRCLELGAGGGSVARWLVERTGPTGEVVATDLNTRHLPEDEGYAVLRHDLVADPLPAGEWDLIHARLVLSHLSGREEILRRLAGALAPGGVLALEEWDGTMGNTLIASTDQATRELFHAYHLAIRRILEQRGADGAWAARLHSAMQEAGLVDVDTELHARAWPGGSAGAMLNIINLDQLHDDLPAVGFDRDRMERLRQAMTDPRNVNRSLVTYSTIGRRPPV